MYEIWTERRNAQPILEPSLFKSSIFSVSSLVTVIFGMGLFGSISFIPLFVQGGQGGSATNSGVILMPLMLTAMAPSIISGQSVPPFGRHKSLLTLTIPLMLVRT